MRIRPSSTHGFTLIELIIAVTISAVIAALLISVATSALGIWNRASDRWATSSVGNAVLDQVEADLKSAVFQSKGRTELALKILTVTSTSGNWKSTAVFPKPTGDGYVSVLADDIAQCRFGTGGAWLRFFIGASGANGNNRAVVKAVAYQIVRREQSNGEVGYALFRSLVSDIQTFGQEYDIAAGLYATSKTGTEGNVGNINNPSLSQAIADHIMDFGVRFYSIRNNRLVPLMPANDQGWVNSTDDFTVNTAGGNPAPDVAEVMVRVLTDEGLRMMRLYEAPPAGFQPTETWWSLVERHSHVYVRRFAFSSRRP